HMLYSPEAKSRLWRTIELHPREWHNYNMIILILSFFLLLFPASVQAKYDPRTVPNNKFGIHVADVNDIADTAALVNSSGGDWGYVTIVMQNNDRDFGKWHNIFNQMRRLHLIPIIRLATHPQGNYWTKPQIVDANITAQFLDSLNWPIENRYVVLFNEPNHAKEWGNEINPEGYAEVFVTYAQALKSVSDDFFILPAGFDSSAANTSDTLDAEEFIKRMVVAKPEILDLLDGWTSHSYPNPGFSGSPLARGKGTIRSYLWELDFIGKNLPVFVTETGWVNTVANNLRTAASSVWQDPAIVAVTPFVFSYQGEPFDNFSWKKLGVNEFYPHYFEYQGLSKVKGTPKQRHSFIVGTSLIPDILVSSSHYNLELTIQNTGQAIVGTKEGYSVTLTAPVDFEIILDSIPSFEPGETAAIKAKLTTPKTIGENKVKLSFIRGNETYTIEEKTVTIVPPPSLSVEAKLGWRRVSNASDVTVLVYESDTIIHKFTGLSIDNGILSVDGLTDIIPGNSYRVVVLVPYYLPRQTVAILKGDITTLSFRRFLPLDINGDGALTISDIVLLITSRPADILPRFFGP
ncbi:MAG: hypothetical protein ACD_48C00562G0002, partial [uncultured bacterium]